MDSLSLADIRECWDEVRLGLEVVKQKTNPPWRVEDVYAACVVGSAVLYLGEPGFVIFQPETNRLTGKPELLVWVAFSRDRDAVSRFQPAVDSIAREAGYKTLVMWSNRPGWERNEGWTQVATVYERAL